MTRFTRYLGVAALAVVLVLAAACGNDGTTAGGTASPTPTETTFDEPEWSITTPAGWTREDVTSSADATKAIRYKSAAGDYLIVAIDPLGSDFRSDTVWRYEAKASGFEIVEKTECTGSAEDCSTNDARYDGHALWKSGTEPPKVGGHVWFFSFGNTERTSIDAGVFEGILESIRVKG